MIKPGIIEILDFEPEFRNKLPETYRLLKTAYLKVHPNVQRITLHGSRGLAGGFSDDSDIDLCLITEFDDLKLPGDELDNLLKNVIQTTSDNSN
jgi:predicted nucleotidyltransferase